ncbi:hypothetical protein [Haloimpatiens massiliensis]|uniref:hypothetical protein n=1 Tax=Haloimpatiens massiliensis TaxID=1658110 RepID=UPI0015E06994|nr:hypothetical protein [Haloimpatiens massiliensis]
MYRMEGPHEFVMNYHLAVFKNVYYIEERVLIKPVKRSTNVMIYLGCVKEYW